MLSVSGPVVPSPSKNYLVEPVNDHLTSHYYHALPEISAQLPDLERTISHSFVHIKADGTFLDPLSTSLPTTSIPESIQDPDVRTFKYKPVAKKIKPLAATLPEEFRTTRKIVGDPLADMPQLSTHPPEFEPTGRYTEEACEIVEANHPGDFLLPEERKLMHHFMMKFKCGFAWKESQKGKFREDFFPPLKMPVVPHVPWALRNIPIPPGIYNEVVKIIRDKIQ